MRRAAGTCLATRGGDVLRRVGCSLESLGAASSNLMARYRGLPTIRRVGVLREASARAPFHLRGAGECSSGGGVRHPRPHGGVGCRLHAQNHQEESLVMGDVTELRPLVLGYARLAPFAGPGRLAQVQARLAGYAQQQGLRLGTVYFERAGTAPHFEYVNAPPSAFADLLAGAAPRTARVTGVVVPSLDDFGEQKDERIAELEDRLGLVVRAADTADGHDSRE